MSQAVSTQLAEAITREIERTEFDGIRLSPVRSYADWTVALEDQCEADHLYCDVVFANYADAELDTREDLVYRCEVDVVLRQRLGPSCRSMCGRIDASIVDRLMLIVELIHEHFSEDGDDGRRLQDFPDAAWIATRIRLAYSREQLTTAGQFTSVIRLTYEVPK